MCIYNNFVMLQYTDKINKSNVELKNIFNNFS